MTHPLPALACSVLLAIFVAGCGASAVAGGATAAEPVTTEPSVGDEGGERDEATGPSSATESGDSQAVADDDAYDALVAHDAALAEGLSSGAVDCGAAHQLVERICYLAARACVYADVSDSGDALERSNCAEGQARCESAQERVQAACGAAR